MTTTQPRVAILGAGLIGLYVGGTLSLNGVPVVFIGRERMLNSIKEAGGIKVEGKQFECDYRLSSEDYSDLDVDVILVALKTGFIEDLTVTFRTDIPIVSLCNGLDAVDLLRKKFPLNNVHAGMVGFNVIQAQPFDLLKTTSGDVYMEKTDLTENITKILRNAGIGASARTDMLEIMWAKLLINSNNAVNALAGIPLATQLKQQKFRLIWAGAMREGLKIVNQKGIVPAKLTPISPYWLPFFLELPDFVFNRLAKSMVSVDIRAGSSMQEDITAHRTTEIRYLNGYLTKQSDDTPVNQTLVKLVTAAEQEQKGSPKLTADEIISKINEGTGWKPTSSMHTSCSVM
eukprot:TRINITY_DN1112_c3_g1_i1.p1 TRINITY_DN1112_c3_g1~~TRINITY_DN1112_c3_g1_i1.p1  ORF type:complete len:345 (+),score=57.47 TRINITY_DN1112_c3_g1_i1:50-1084(+)